MNYIKSTYYITRDILRFLLYNIFHHKYIKSIRKLDHEIDTNYKVYIMLYNNLQSKQWNPEIIKSLKPEDKDNEEVIEELHNIVLRRIYDTTCTKFYTYRKLISKFKWMFWFSNPKSLCKRL